MRAATLATALLALAGCLTPASPAYEDAAPDAPEPSPYAGEEARDIKALSADEIEGYATGAGLGYAKPAELNHYPGPLHVLQLADELRLSEAQRAQMTRIREDMLAVAVPLGERYLANEAEIERRFRDGTMDARTLERLLDESADLEAQIRFAHLEAHVDARALLAPEQVARYDELRGYATPTREGMGEDAPAGDHTSHEHGS